jgi:hypothetical protein
MKSLNLRSVMVYKLEFFQGFFGSVLLFDGTFTSFFKDKKSKKKKKEIKGFLTFWLVDGRSGSEQKMTDPDPGGSKTYGSRSAYEKHWIGYSENRKRF